MSTPTFEVGRARCSRCQKKAERPCLRINGIAICQRCLQPVWDELDHLAAVMWLEKQ